jgi:hypothetical protein
MRAGVKFSHKFQLVQAEISYDGERPPPLDPRQG